MMKTQKAKKARKENKIYGKLKYILLTALCAIFVFLLTTVFLTCLTLRYYIKTSAIPKAVGKVVLEEIQIAQPDGSELSIAQYILDEFIQDERIRTEDVQEIIENGTFSDFAVVAVEQYNQYLANGGEFPEIDPEEFVTLLEENADLIYEKTGLRFLEPDKQKLRDNLEYPIQTLNETLESCMYHGVIGFFLRIAVSLWVEIVLAVILLLLLVWMIIIHVRAKKKIGTGLKIYGITANIPCTVMFLVGLLMSWILKFIHLPSELGTALRGKTVLFSGLGIIVCVILFCFGMFWNFIAGKLTAKAEMPVQEKSESIAMPSQEPPKRVFCRYCGEKLVNDDAQFCYQCGKRQS